MSLKVKKNNKEFNYNTKVVVAVACRAVLLCYRQRKAGSTPAVTEGSQAGMSGDFQSIRAVERKLQGLK